MNIAVVIPTWNNSARLRITLHSFTMLDIAPRITWTLIVVDNNSTDNTRDVIQTFRDTLPLISLFEGRQGLSKAKNAGLRSAMSADIVLFADDDVRVPAVWITEYAEAFKRFGPDCYFGGPVHSEFECGPPPAELARFAPPSVMGLNHGDFVKELADTGVLLAANWGCRPDALLEVGGFDESLGLNGRGIQIGEESDLMRRLSQSGLRAIYLPKAPVWHFVPQKKTEFNHIATRFLCFVEATTETTTESRSRLRRAWLWVRELFQGLKWLRARAAGRPGYVELIHMQRFRLLRALARADGRSSQGGPGRTA